MANAKEKKLIDAINALDPLDPHSKLGPFDAYVTERANRSGKTEAFKVIITKSRNGGLKLQWDTSQGRPGLPDLKPKTRELIQKTMGVGHENNRAYLTSGFNTARSVSMSEGGMSKAEEVVAFINILFEAGIEISMDL